MTKPKRIVWKETSRREIEPYIHVPSRPGAFAYAARRWVVTEFCPDVGIREQIITGTPLYGHEIPAFFETIMRTANDMNELIKGLLRERCPSGPEEEEKAKIPHLDRVAKVIGR